MVTNHNRKSFGLCQKNSKSCSDDWQPWRFWSAFRHFGTHSAESFRMAKSSWMMNPTCSHEMPSCSAIDLVKIRLSSNISLWIWSIISGVVTVLGQRRGATQVEKSPRLNWATQFLMVAYDGACSPNVSVRKCTNFLLCLTLQGRGKKKKKKNMMTARVSLLLKSCVSPNMFPFSLCNKNRLAIRHMNRPLLSDTINSILQQWEVGQAKGLSAPPCTMKQIP